MSKIAVQDDIQAETLVPKLIAISKAMRALHGIKLGALGFHNGQDELLLAVGKEGVTTSALADQLCIRPSTVSKMMDRLTEKGLVERAGDPRDGRRTMVRITPAGVEARTLLLNLRQELDAELTSSLPMDARATIIQSLAECQTHLSKRLARLR